MSVLNDRIQQEALEGTRDTASDSPPEVCPHASFHVPIVVRLVSGVPDPAEKAISLCFLAHRENSISYQIMFFRTVLRFLSDKVT